MMIASEAMARLHVVPSDRADAAADHPQADLFADVELEQCILQGFHRTGQSPLMMSISSSRSPALNADSRSSSVTRRRPWANWATRSRASRRSAICLAGRSSATT